VPDIFDTRHITATPDTMWPFLTTKSGLESWWTIGKTEVAGDPVEHFRFASGPVVTELVTEAIDATRLSSRCIDSNAPGGWTDTIITFDLIDEGQATRLEFAHRGFAQDNDGFRRVTAGWSQYLDQLKTAAEAAQS